MKGCQKSQKFCICGTDRKFGPLRSVAARHYTRSAARCQQAICTKNPAHSSGISQVLRIVTLTVLGFFLQKNLSFLTNSPIFSSCHLSRVLSSKRKVLYFESGSEKSQTNSPPGGIVQLGLFLQLRLCSFLRRSKSLVVPTFNMKLPSLSI